MDYLPCEMIEHIYSFLPYYDKLRATEVCSRWRDIFEARVINSTVLTIAQKRISARKLTFASVMQRLVRSSRDYPDVKFQCIDFTKVDRLTDMLLGVLLANMSLDMLRLTLKECRLSFCKLYQIVHLMKQLEKLDVSNCRIFDDEFPLPNIAVNLPNLESVGFHNVKSECEIRVMDLLTRGNNAEIEISVEDNYVDQNTQLVTRYSKRLKHLSCTFSESRTIRQIFDSPELILESLHLRRSPSDRLHCVTLLETLARQHHLQKLSFSMPTSINVLAEIATNMTKLEILSITISNEDIVVPVCLIWPKLKVLHLSHSGDINLVLFDMKFNSLEELQLRTEKLSKYTLTNIYDKCPTLKKLSISALSMMRCETLLGSIADKMPKLTEIEIMCSSRTTFIPFFQSIRSLQRLSSLTIYFCEKITDNTMEHIELPLLKVLKITQNNKISKEGLQILLTNCPRIESLSMRCCARINDDAVKVITMCLPRLEYLDISESMQITLNSIRYVMSDLRYLRDLKLDGCRRILTQWRFAPYYISDICSLRSYYNEYPEFFHYNLPLDELDEPDSDDCYYYDSTAEDSDDLGDYVEDEDQNDVPNGNDDVEQEVPEDNDEDIIVLSDDDY